MGYFPEVHSIDELKRQHRRLMQMYHPDVGGNTIVAQEINAEYDALFEKLKAQEEEQRANTAPPEDAPPTPPPPPPPPPKQPPKQQQAHSDQAKSPPPPKQKPKNQAPQGGKEAKKAKPKYTCPAAAKQETIHYNLEPERIPGGYCFIALLVLLGAFIVAILFGWAVGALN